MDFNTGMGLLGTPGDLQSVQPEDSRMAGFFATATGLPQRMMIIIDGVVHLFAYPGSHQQQYLWDINNSEYSVRLTACCNEGVGFLRSPDGSSYTTISVPGRSVGQMGLNNNNVVVGSANINGTPGAFIWQNRSATLFNRPGAAWTQLFDINDSGMRSAVIRRAMATRPPSSQYRFRSPCRNPGR